MGSLRIAWHQAWAGVRVRPGRHLLTEAGICLGTCLLGATAALREASGPADRDRLTWMAAASLVMCVLGITNSMLLSVTERVKEIGTIKCLGASNGFIASVFALEAALLGGVGSCAGALLGSLTALAGRWLGEIPATLTGALQILPFSFGVGFAMTMISSLIPAMQAARMPAMSALRVEV